MKQNKTAILVLLALVALMICAGILYSRLSSGFSMDVISSEAADPSASEEELTPAPDFTVYDFQGNEVSLSDFRGKPVVLNFWASWCGPCKREMPDFESIYQELGEDVEFMMVNVTDGSRETRDSAAEFIAGEGYTFPVYYDSQLEPPRPTVSTPSPAPTSSMPRAMPSPARPAPSAPTPSRPA